MSVKKLFHRIFSSAPDVADNGKPVPEIRFRAAVVGFYDHTGNFNGQKLTDLLQHYEGLEVFCLKPDFDLSFLNFESRNFFDLLDRGRSLLEKSGADVLVWGYCNNGRMRLNFQIPQQYENGEKTFIRLLDSMYLPAAAVENGHNLPPPLPDLLAGTIISAVGRTSREEQIYKKYLLRKIIDRISRTDSAKDLDLNHMPYILSQIGLIYMTVAADKCNENDFEIIGNLFTAALKYRDRILEPTELGCIYLHLGQLNDYASVYMGRRSGFYFREAIRFYQQAQKFFGKYTYPYDYGHICYKLSGLYYNYWKRTEDLQALRDSVAQLRECERIFTEAQFPQFWSKIEGSLGYLLHNLARLTGNTEICRLAAAAYRNRQKIVSESRQPFFWAQIQEKIAEIHYLEGKISANPEALEEALECYHDALYFYETGKHENAAVHARNGIAKTRQLLETIKN